MGCYPAFLPGSSLRSVVRAAFKRLCNSDKQNTIGFLFEALKAADGCSYGPAYAAILFPLSTCREDDSGRKSFKIPGIPAVPYGIPVKIIRRFQKKPSCLLVLYTKQYKMRKCLESRNVFSILQSEHFNSPLPNDLVGFPSPIFLTFQDIKSYAYLIVEAVSYLTGNFSNKWPLFMAFPVLFLPVFSSVNF